MQQDTSDFITQPVLAAGGDVSHTPASSLARPRGHISIRCVQPVPLNVTPLINKPIRKRNARRFGWDGEGGEGGGESGADRLGVLRGNISPPPQPDAGDKDTLQPNSSWKMLEECVRTNTL